MPGIVGDVDIIGIGSLLRECTGDERGESSGDVAHCSLLFMPFYEMVDEVVLPNEDHDPCHNNLPHAQTLATEASVNVLEENRRTTLPIIMRKNKIACWNGVRVLRLTVERPVTVKAE